MSLALRHPPHMKNRLRIVSSRLSFASGVVASTLLAAACQDAERELGYTQTDQDLRGQPSEPFFGAPDDFAGRWIGSAEDPLALGGGDATYRFPSGSRRFVLDIEPSLDEFGNEEVDVRIVFGDAEPLPAPVDPEAGYPVGVSYRELLTYDEQDFVGTNPDQRLPPFEGFDYRAWMPSSFTGENGELLLGDGLLLLSFNANEPLDAWCQLQTPHEVPGAPGSFQCSEQFGGQIDVNPDGTGASCGLWAPPNEDACPAEPSFEDFATCVDFGEPIAFTNCDKLFLCSQDFCQCDESACVAGDSSTQVVLRREGDELVGVFSGAAFLNARNMKTPLGEVRLRRAD